VSEVILKVGKRGEIYTSKEIRGRVSIRTVGYVRAIIRDG